VEQALYRVLQESLSNVARHAEADSVSLNLSIAPDQVTLSISDNGRGFEPAIVSTNSLGLAGMKQRLAEVNGALTIESTLAVGTKVTAAVQLAAKDAH
jgi:signal transduction histidine kinase